MSDSSRTLVASTENLFMPLIQFAFLFPILVSWISNLSTIQANSDDDNGEVVSNGKEASPKKWLETLNSNWNQILPLTLSDINLFLPVSAGRDVAAIFNISFSRNKTVGVIYFSANLWMDAPRKLCLCIPLPIFKLCCSVLHDTAELSKPQKVINHQNKNALT